jgi:hypothetical protein
MIFEVDRESRKLLAAFPDGGPADRFECGFSVCAIPTCPCRSVHLRFSSKPSVGDLPIGQQANRQVTLDLDRKGVEPEFRRQALPDQIAFCEKLVGAMDAGDFDFLGNLHFFVKNQLTEEAKPETIDFQFDFAKIESSAQTQTYNKVLPFGNRLYFDIDGQQHVLIDQHCVRVGCNCTDAYLNVLPIGPDGDFGEPAGIVLLDYAGREWKEVPNEVAPGDLLSLRQRVESAFPDFYTRLAQRHAKLQAVYRHCRQRHLATERAAKIALSKKVGRNDPCPCGSGKKYKKCCGVLGGVR